MTWEYLGDSGRVWDMTSGVHSSPTIGNYSAAIHKWYLLHSQFWVIDQDELKLALQGATYVAPQGTTL